jgi:pyroglutamyl-peptidase
LDEVQSNRKFFTILKTTFKYFQLVIHIGVATGTKGIQLERYACNTDYCHSDNNNTVPDTGRCIKKDAPEKLTTCLPLDDICARVKRRTNLPVIVSNDAGRLILYLFNKISSSFLYLRYLCEYIYYQSLFIDPKRTVFIHIPDLDKQFTVENLAETIQLIIYESLHYVDLLPILNQNGNYLIKSKHIPNNNRI